MDSTEWDSTVSAKRQEAEAVSPPMPTNGHRRVVGSWRGWIDMNGLHGVGYQTCCSRMGKKYVVKESTYPESPRC